ncbi:MAG TPA: ATP-binding protein [Gammaproteobacteria bacterium]|nr:ATP-binding protein [Gammaproteobacteria bacterium]
MSEQKVARLRWAVHHMPIPIILSWSGGKDSMLALEALLGDGHYEVMALLTTVNRAHGRISMHGVREGLLDAQAASLGIPLDKIYLPEKVANDEYAAAMRTQLEIYRGRGIRHVAFGDIFLADIRAYRERQLSEVEMQCVFPLWGQSTAALAQRFVEHNFRATLSCVDTQAIDATFAGREYDTELLGELPSDCDPCGENGEFHSFVYAGPLLREPIAIRTGEHVLRDGRFAFCDLVPLERV